jgi:hypothetical protein
MAEVRALLKEQDRQDYEDAALDAEESDTENETMSAVFIGDSRRSKEGWLKAWARMYGIPSVILSLFARSTLIPPCRGVTIMGDPEANEKLVVGDIGRDDIHCAIGHILFLINGRRIRTTFNTMEGYHIRVEEGDITLGRVLILHIDPVEFAVEGESSHLFPDVNDLAWRCTWENMRPDLVPHFKPKNNFDASRMFTCTDTFSGSRRKERCL